MLRWRSIAEVASDFAHVMETRTSPTEPKVLTAALRQHGWDTVWASTPPGLGEPGMRGRSGGCTLMFTNGWRLEEQLDLQLHNQPHCVVAGHFINDHNNVQTSQCAYYGHPTAKDTTRRDFDHLTDIACHCDCDVMVAGDLNIADNDDEPLPRWTYLQDTAVIRSRNSGTPLDTAFFGTGVPSRLDRVFSAASLEHHLQTSEALDEATVPGHKAIRVAYPQRPVLHPVQVARPSLPTQIQGRHTTAATSSTSMAAIPITPQAAQKLPQQVAGLRTRLHNGKIGGAALWQAITNASGAGSLLWGPCDSYVPRI